MPERTLHIPEASLAYNTKLDVKAYLALKESGQYLNPEAYQKKLATLNNLTRLNLQTSLGERYNVELFQINYYIEDGLIKHSLYQEPFIDTIRRGQQFRLANGSTDVAREIAEIVGFEKVGAILIDEEPGGEKKVVVISPKGVQDSIYQHNFFDVYQGDKDGQIVMSRFTCKFSYREFYDAATNIDPFVALPKNPKDVDFLANPLIIYQNIGDIQKTFHPQEATMSHYQYQELLEVCAPLIACYLKALTNPNFSEVTKIYNALLNYADEIILLRSGPLKPIKTTWVELYNLKGRTLNIEGFVSLYGNQPVRQVTTACGISGSSQNSSILPPMNLFRPFSVSEFGLSTSSCSECAGPENHFHCPGCGKQIISGQGITTCPHCGLTKEQAGSKCG